MEGSRSCHCAPEKSVGALCGTSVAPVMAAVPRKRVRAPWGRYQAFGRNGVAMWGGSKVEIDLEVTLGLCKLNVGWAVVAASRVSVMNGYYRPEAGG